MKKWIDIEEFLAVQELDKLRSRGMIAWMRHNNWLKVQEMGLDAYLKQFEE